jgi:predicted CXXCH cytochrome family protein
MPSLRLRREKDLRPRDRPPVRGMPSIAWPLPSIGNQVAVCDTRRLSPGLERKGDLRHLPRRPREPGISHENGKTRETVLLPMPRRTARNSWGCKTARAYREQAGTQGVRAGPLRRFHRPGLRDVMSSRPAEIRLGAGIFNHNSGGSHPIGVDYTRAFTRGGFAHPSRLDPSVVLFNGKIGCGTCHNLYSKRKYYLSASNERSALCFQCHVK